MADFGRYVFFDEWRVGAAPQAVWTVIRDAAVWPQWWPSVRRTTRLDPGARDGAEEWEFRFRTRLPYDMVFIADLQVDDAELRVTARTTGRVVGHAVFQVGPIDGGSLLRFDWEVRPQIAWMRAVAPVARPVFAGNHRSLMAEGAFGLARRLDTRLLGPPAGALLPA
jgi:Polyketide cyclase / dehydrase and lipid transport